MKEKKVRYEKSIVRLKLGESKASSQRKINECQFFLLIKNMLLETIGQETNVNAFESELKVGC